VSFSRIAENRIKEAMAKGDFDRLPGSGRPLDLEEYFATPEEFRVAFSILKNARCAPAEVELLNEIARLKDAMAAADSPAEEGLLQRRLTERQMQLAVIFEHRARRPRGGA
jgi:hypothetical protein